MKIKVAPRPLPRTPQPLPRPQPLARPAGAGSRPLARWAGADTKRWYEALGRLVGVTPDEAFRVHFPGQAGEPTPATRAAFARTHVSAPDILAELKRA